MRERARKKKGNDLCIHSAIDCIYIHIYIKYNRNKIQSK
jgi:hypothetical protein